MTKLDGECLCGAVKYTADVEPAMVAVCHCKNCQRQAGTAFGVIVGIPKEALNIQGNLKRFKDTGDSGQDVFRDFCPNCGSPITTNPEAARDLTFIKAGTLNDTSWLKPTMDIYCESAQSWVPMVEGSSKFPKMPQ